MSIQTLFIRDFGRKSFLVWFRLSRSFFVLLFFLAIGFGALLWYDNVYHGEWTEEEKSLYAKMNFQETVFREGEFQKAVESTRNRAERYKEPVGISNDFFLPIPGVGKKEDFGR